MSFWTQRSADFVEWKGLYADCILHHNLFTSKCVLRRAATIFSMTFDRKGKFDTGL